MYIYINIQKRYIFSIYNINLYYNILLNKKILSKKMN